jgi:hypothetical protein
MITLRCNTSNPLAVGLLALIVSTAYAQTIPTISAKVTTTQNQSCTWNTNVATSINYTGNYSATCSSTCPAKNWAASPATLSQQSTGICNYASPTIIAEAAVGLLSFPSMLLATKYLGWPNYGPPTFWYQQGTDTTNNRSWAQGCNQSYVENNSLSVGVSILIASVTFVIPLGQAGPTTCAPAYMSCAASGSSSQ